MHEFLEISSLEKHFSEYPGSIIFAFLAFRNLEQGNTEKALAICENGVKRHPEYPFGHFVLGLCHYHLKDYAKAKTHLEIATAFDDKNPQAWKLLGEINEHLDLPIQADECNLKYYLLDSFNPDALEKYQKGEIIDFDVFKKQDEYDFTPPEKPAAEQKAKETEAAEEKTETTPLIEEVKEVREVTEIREVEEDEEKQSPILIKKDEFMEKMTRDISFDDEDELSETFSEDTEAAQPPQMQEATSEESKEQSTEPDLSDSESQGSLELDLDEEIRRGFEDTGAEVSEELLDFRSVVKDIISENDDESPEVSRPPSPKATEKEEGVNEEEIEVGKLGRPPILTPTIGEIYIAQGRFKEAIDVFEQLLEKEPDNHRFQKKIKDIRVIMEKQNA
jgi:tetratricopeptide (TPR) repeat protein